MQMDFRTVAERLGGSFQDKKMGIKPTARCADIGRDEPVAATDRPVFFNNQVERTAIPRDGNVGLCDCSRESGARAPTFRPG